jgi:hypothetical protein
MTTTTRKPVARHAHLSPMTNGKQLLGITKDGETFFYVLTPLTSAWGKAYQLGKASVDGSMESYNLLLDDHHHHSCDCAGFTFRNKCKHVDSLVALTKAGKLN